MDVSRAVTVNPAAGNWQATCDFLPDRHEQSIADQLVADGKRTVAAVLADWLPRRVAMALAAVANVPARSPRRRVVQDRPPQVGDCRQATADSD